MKSRKVVLALMVLVLLAGIGAKVYSTITMGDDEWIGLGANAGRIVFDDQTKDEVSIMDADLGINTLDPDSHYGAGVGATPLIEIEGPTRPGLAIHDTGQAYNYTLVADGNDLSLCYGAWLNLMTWQYDGKVGVGTRAPAYELDVIGDIHASDDVFVGDELDVAGEAFALQLTTDGDVCARDDIIAYDSVYALGSLYANVDVTAGGDVRAEGYIIAADGDVIAEAGNIIAGANITATGNVCGTEVHGTYVASSGDVTALGNLSGVDVVTNETVFIGSAEDGDEDGARMSIRADDADGGYVIWAIRNFEGTVYIFEDSSSTGPDEVLWVRWLTHSNTTGAYTSGETYLVNGPHVQDTVTIASDGAKLDLYLSFYQDEVVLGTAGAAGHLYDVTLVGMWVQD